MKLLILGSSGFIGKSLTEYFKDKYEVFSPLRAELNAFDGTKIENYLQKNQFDIVLNAIGSTMPDSNPQYIKDRLQIFFNIARCSNLYGRQLFFGSGAEYSRALPIVSVKEEDFDRKVPEDNYGLMMYTCAKYSMLSNNIYDYRLFGTFGQYEDYSIRFVIGAVIKSLLGLPITIRQDCVFDYLYINDICRYVDYFINNDLKHKAYNVTSGKKYKLTDIANTIKKISGKNIQVVVCKDGLGNEYSGDNSRIVGETGCVPSNIEDGIKSIIDYYEKNLDKVDAYRLLYGGVK